MTPEGDAWGKAHDAYLECHLHRLRLLVERRVRWLRAQGTDSEPPEDRERAGDGRDGLEATADGAREDGTERLLATQALDAEAAVLQRDEHTARLSRAVAAHEARLRKYEHELAALGGHSGLTTLQAAAGLSQVETDAVVVALAPELDPAFRGLFAYVQDDPTARHATLALVAALTQRPLPEIWDLLDPEAPSQRFRLFEPAAGGAGAPLRLDARVVDYLRGVNHLDERLAGLVDPLGELPLPAALRAIVDRLAAWLADPDRHAGHAVVNLIGPSGQGREAIAASVARSLGLLPLRLRLDGLRARSDVAELIRLVDREALLLPAAVYTDAPDRTGDDFGATAAAHQALDEVGGLLFVGSRQRWEGRRPAIAVMVPPLRPADRLELWHAALGETVPEDALAGVVQQFALGPEATVRAADEAVGLAELRTGAVPSGADLWAACRTRVGRDLAELARRDEPTAGWDELVLPERELALLRDIAAQVAARPRVYEQWGFGARLARGRGISALFTGPSGTGKTMAAEIIAGHLDLDLYRIDLSAVVSKYIGETEKNLRRVFDAADTSGAILFFDEADALFGKRTEVKDSHDRHANVEINYLLQRMEDYEGLAILATNRKTDLDPAFLRRIRFVVTFPFPKPEHRRRIWQTVFPPQTPLADLDYDALARLEIAGGNIRNIAVNAAFLAAHADEPVAMPHVLRAARHEYAKLDRLPSRREFGRHYEPVNP